ncbi:MAG: CHASE2 domain-containing protein [Limnothrix sp. RL_2_0]|nr:CHASE2 domain-containing protein [Limnothrix sp. RL_2_0]
MTGYPSALLSTLKEWQRTYLGLYKTNPKKNSSEASIGEPSQVIEEESSFKIKRLEGIRVSKELVVTKLKSVEKKLLDQFEAWVNLDDFVKIRDFILNKIGVPTVISHVENIKLNFDEIQLFIHCKNENNDEDLDFSKLPWETWQIFPENLNSIFLSKIRILRSVNNPQEKIFAPILDRPKTRFLVLIGEDSKLEFYKEKNTIKKLQKSRKVDVHFLDVNGYQTKEKYVKKLGYLLEDDSGWDALFVVAHSSENHNGGRIKLSSNISFNLEELKDELITAKSNGLRFAFLNSCEGISIAQFLINIGLHQVLLMREKIRDDIAQFCSEIFINRLIAGNSIEVVFQNIREELKKKQIIYPSAYLIPTLFSYPHLDVPSFQVDLKFWKYYSTVLLPKQRREQILIASSLFLSLIFPTHDILTDIRFFVQAIAAHANPLTPTQVEPPIQLISIDQESINDAQLSISEFEDFPIDRRYLAKIIEKLNSLDAKIVGMNYLLSQEEDANANQELQIQLENFVRTDQSWLVFTTDLATNKVPLKTLANPQWSLLGDGGYRAWQMDIPENSDCQDNCPFSFGLANLFRIRTNIDPQQLKFVNDQMEVQNEVAFKKEIWDQVFVLNQEDDFLNTFNIQVSSDEKVERSFSIQLILQAVSSILMPYSLIDYSVPPNLVYEKMSAQKFLGEGQTDKFKRKFRDRIVIISAGDYTAVDEYNSSLPIAMHYWCWVQPRFFKLPESSCDRLLTSGEIHAYMTYQYLEGENLRQVSFMWTTVFGIIIGKLIHIYLISLDRETRERKVMIVKYAVGSIGIANIMIFMILSLSIPYFFPALIMLCYSQWSLGKQNAFT